jgi:hypothetical protein
LHSRFHLSGTVLLLVVLTGLVSAVPAGTAAPLPVPAGIGIRLLEAPVARRHDPRARIYIVDHVAPGSTIQRRLSVENTTAEKLHIKMYAGGADIGHDRFLFPEETKPTELTGWMSFDQPHLDVEAGGKATVLATIAVPPLASAGERYGVIWAENPSPATVPGSIGMSNRVGIRVYLSVGLGGEPPSDFRIESLTPAREEDGRPKVLAQVRNTGKRALDLGGTLRLSDGPGSLSAGPFSVGTRTTLGIGRTAPVVVYLDKRLPNGPWTAELTLRSGMVERTAKGIITFPDKGTGEPVMVDLVNGAPHVFWYLMVGIAFAGTILLFLRARALRRKKEAQLHSVRR